MSEIKLKEIRAGKRSYYLPPEGGDRSEARLRQLFDSEYLQAHARDLCRRGGRGQTVMFTLDDMDLVLRPYLRGGLFGRAVKTTFFGCEHMARRAFLELKLLCTLQEAGFPCPKPLAALEVRTLTGYRNFLLTWQIKGSENLAEIIARRKLEETELVRIREALGAMFSLGVMHTDLNLRNILLTGSQCFVIDFDKCFITDLSRKQRAAMIARLRRSFAKEAGLRPVHFDSVSFEIMTAGLTA